MWKLSRALLLSFMFMISCIVKQVSFAGTSFHKLGIIANLIDVYLCENGRLTVIVNVKFTVSRQFNFTNLGLLRNSVKFRPSAKFMKLNCL